LRFQYLLKFLRNIADILAIYTDNTGGILNKEVVELIENKIREIERSRYKWGNIRLKESALDNLPKIKSLLDKGDLNSITLTDIIKKIEEQEAIFNDILNTVSAILGTGEEGFRGWLVLAKDSSVDINYKEAKNKINKYISSLQKSITKKPPYNDLKYQLTQDTEILKSNVYGIVNSNKTVIYTYTDDPIKEYNDKNKPKNVIPVDILFLKKSYIVLFAIYFYILVSEN
jgi:hypothetical protein